MNNPDAVITIGIVDDHKLFRQGLRQILGSDPRFRVGLEAGSCRELFAALAGTQPDVLLMDLQMPDMDGMEGCGLLLEQYPDLKIIILSMHAADHFIYHMMKLGVRSYLPKDIDQQRLKEAIGEVVVDGYFINDRISKAMLKGMRSAAPAKPTFGANTPSLTHREQEVLQLICQGQTTQQMADQLFISVRTVEGHRKNLLEKTGTPNSVSLAVFAIRHNLLDRDEASF
jgi:DNA-binding NarL/FixJ family response regulator